MQTVVKPFKKETSLKKEERTLIFSPYYKRFIEPKFWCRHLLEFTWLIFIFAIFHFRDIGRFKFVRVGKTKASRSLFLQKITNWNCYQILLYYIIIRISTQMLSPKYLNHVHLNFLPRFGHWRMQKQELSG